MDGEREYRLKPLAARLSLAYLQEFEDPLPQWESQVRKPVLGLGTVPLSLYPIRVRLVRGNEYVSARITQSAEIHRTLPGY